MEGPLIAAFNATLARLKEIEDEIARLETYRNELVRERAVLIADLSQARMVLAHVAPQATSGSEGEAPQPRARRRPIRRTSSVGAAIKVLRTANRPMHIDEMLKMIQHMTGMPVQKTTLVSNLARYVKAGDTFRRVAPSTYELIPPDEEDREIRLVG